ncbi:LamB/YcsF family protein [Nocardioides sp.]|uniref:LamB/YcsF family protein n=1 Tax=Nocardioides sp. TaxID=35761 RepID=UPI003568FABA
MRYIDLNADLGEEVSDDTALLEVVTSANVACGYHAGNATIMAAVCEGAARLGVAVGAQVSYDDRANFGRVPVDLDPELLREHVADQVETLETIAARSGLRVSYVKPHGALYHRVLDDPAQAQALLDASGSLPVLTMDGALARLAAAAGRRVVAEGFPDRGYAADGRLLPRTHPDALIEEESEVSAAAVALAQRVASVCVHGDSQRAVAHARAVRAALEDAGFSLRRF